MNKTINNLILVTSGTPVELADGAPDGSKRYWKQIAKYGEFVDPRGGLKKMVINKELADKLVANFKSGVRGFIPVPLGHPQSDAELADKNRGALIDAQARDDGLYGLIEIRDPETADKIDKGMITDDSIAFDDDYQDKKTGNWVGPTLKHVGLVVNPYLKGMTAFQPVNMSEGASAASLLFSEGSQQVEVTDEKNNLAEGDNMLVDVKNEQPFDVDVTYTDADGKEQKTTVKAGETVSVPQSQADAVKKQIADATDPEDAADGADDEGAEGELSDVKKAEKALSEREARIAKRETELAEKTARANWATLLSEGKVTPAQEASYMALATRSETSVELSDGTEKTIGVLLSELFEKAAPSRRLSEQGAEGDDGDDGDDEEVELSDEEKSFGEDFGNTPEEIAAFKKKQQ